ncbi:MAG: biopolymer transporter ExbD [Desulfobacterales bacterium]|nr:biopolymer transporter ExbD [Desulfobacterales bacterium]
MKVPSSYLGIKKPRIEMLPLIDIVFLLLVFFIYAMLSMAVHHSLPVSLPVSSTAQIDIEQSLTVSVMQNGEIFLDKIKISLEELQLVLQDKAQKVSDGKDVQVDLFADEALSYQELYRVLDIIRTAGISNVSLQAGGHK